MNTPTPPTPSTAGFGTTGFIVAFVGIAVIAGLVVTQSGGSDTDVATTNTPGALQQAAETRAQAETAVVTEAAAERAELMEDKDSMMDDHQADAMKDMPETDLSTAPTEDTTPAVAVDPGPAPTTVAAAGMFSDFAESKLSDTGTNVLFFHAEWCPSCKGLERDLTANAAAIPEGVNILKLDYDEETELKKKYGVIRQHTLVVVDGDGNEIKKLTGLTNTLDQVVGQL